MLKHYFERISKTYFAMTELYDRKKEKRQNESNLKLVKMFSKQHRVIKLRQEMKKEEEKMKSLLLKLSE